MYVCMYVCMRALSSTSTHSYLPVYILTYLLNERGALLQVALERLLLRHEFPPDGRQRRFGMQPCPAGGMSVDRGREGGEGTDAFLDGGLSLPEGRLEGIDVGPPRLGGSAEPFGLGCRGDRGGLGLAPGLEFFGGELRLLLAAAALVAAALGGLLALLLGLGTPGGRRIASTRCNRGSGRLRRLVLLGLGAAAAAASTTAAAATAAPATSTASSAPTAAATSSTATAGSAGCLAAHGSGLENGGE